MHPPGPSFPPLLGGLPIFSTQMSYPELYVFMALVTKDATAAAAMPYYGTPHTV